MLRHCRDLKNLSNQELAAILDWPTVRIVGILSAGRPLRRTKAVEVFRALRKADVYGLPRREARVKAHEVNELIDRVLPGVEMPVQPPPALIPALMIPAVAARLAATVFPQRSGLGEKRRADLADGLARALKRAAPEMAFMFCQYFPDWTNSKGAAWVVRGYRKQLESMGFVFKEKS
jgi:hypothetical protein